MANRRMTEPDEQAPIHGARGGALMITGSWPRPGPRACEVFRQVRDYSRIRTGCDTQGLLARKGLTI